MIKSYIIHIHQISEAHTIHYPIIIQFELSGGY